MSAGKNNLTANSKLLMISIALDIGRPLPILSAGMVVPCTMDTTDRWRIAIRHYTAVLYRARHPAELLTAQTAEAPIAPAYMPSLI